MLDDGTALLAPGTVEVLHQHRRHRVERRIGGGDRSGADPHRHQPAQAAGKLGEDIVHEDADLLAAERAGGGGGGPAHQVGSIVEDIEHQADDDEHADHRHGRQHREIQAARAGLRILAGQQPLRGVLVHPGIGDVEQRQPGDDREHREGPRQIEREIEQPQLVHALRRVGQRLDDLAVRGGDRQPQEHQHRDRGAEIDDELDQVVPQHRLQAADEREQDAGDDQDGGGDHDALRVDAAGDHHRQRDRRQIHARAAGKDPADQEHAARPAGRLRAEPQREQFIGGRGADRVEARYQDVRDEDRPDQPADIAAEIGQVAVIAIVRATQEGRGGLRRGQHRDGGEPGGHVAAGEEIVMRRRGLARREDPAARHQQQDIGGDHEPVGHREWQHHRGRLRPAPKRSFAGRSKTRVLKTGISETGVAPAR